MVLCRYKKAIEDLKDVSEDSLISGPENAVWWTEYVIRNNGARHLRSPAVGISFFKYHMLDIWSLIISVAILALYITQVILRYIVRRLRLRFLRREMDLDGKFKAL